MSHAFGSTVQTFKTASGKTGQFYSLPALSQQFPNISPAGLKRALDTIDTVCTRPPLPMRCVR